MKWHGVIGYATSIQTSPGRWKDLITKRNYSGELIRNTSRWTPSSDSTIDNLNINNQISIVADPFAYQNLYSIKYVEFMGAKWKVTNIEVQSPRLILTVGGVYNG